METQSNDVENATIKRRRRRRRASTAFVSTPAPMTLEEFARMILSATETKRPPTTPNVLREALLAR